MKELYWKYSLIIFIIVMGLFLVRQAQPFTNGILGAFTAAVSSLFYIKFRILLFLPVFALLNVTIMISDWFHMQNSSVSTAWYSYFLLFADSKTLYGPVFALAVLLLILLTAAGAYIGGRKDCVR